MYNYSFWVTVKAVTLIIISWRVSAFSSAQEGKSGFIYLVEFIRLLSRAKIWFVTRLEVFTLTYNIQDEILNCRKKSFVFLFLFALPYKIIFTLADTNELRHEISNNVVCAISKALGQSVHMRSLIRAFASHLSIL